MRAAERGLEVELIRRGEKVAVLVSLATLARREGGEVNFWDRLVAFRQEVPRSSLLPRVAIARLRQRDQGRTVKL